MSMVLFNRIPPPPFFPPQACQALHSQLGQGPGSASTVRSLFGITEVLLTGWAAAVAAAPAGNSKSTALSGYRAARGRHVPVLLKEALQELQQGQQGQQQQQLVVVQQEEAGSFVLQVRHQACREAARGIKGRGGLHS